MAQTEISPNKKSAFDRLNEENTSLRQQLTETQKQKYQIHKLVKKQEAQLKVFQLKYSALENQLQKQKGENHRFIEAYEKQKKERLILINNQQSVLNNLNRDEIQLSKFTNQNKSLKDQIQNLQKTLETEKSERVSALREKQNSANKIKLLQTKLQAATMQAKYSKVSYQEQQNQNKRLKESISQLSKKVEESQGPIQVQTIYKDSNLTTQKLLKEFQQKMNDKQSEMIRQIEAYQRKNSQLTLRIAQLELQLLNNNNMC